MRDARHQKGAAGIAPERLASLTPATHAKVPLDIDAETDGDDVYAVANHGRWIVECPDCHNAQLTAASDPRFLCDVCGNAGNGGLYRPVSWPKGREEIGELLDARTDVALQNWSPPETVDTLRRENALLADGPTLLDPPSWADPKWFDPDAPHTHSWPKPTKTLKGSDIIECSDCGLPYPAAEVYPEAFA